MFPLKNRLRNDREFQRVYRRSKKYSTPSCTLFVHRIPTNTIKIGIVATKKYGNAVQRNRAKRTLREAIKDRFPSLREGQHLIFKVNPGNLFPSKHLFERDVSLLIKRAHITKNV